MLCIGCEFLGLDQTFYGPNYKSNECQYTHAAWWGHGVWNFLNNPLHNSLLREPVTIPLIFRLIAISNYCLILSQNIIPYIITEWQYTMHSVSSSSLLFVHGVAGSNFRTWSKYLEWPSQGEMMNFNKKLYLMNFPLIDSIILKLSCVENQNCSLKILGQLCRQGQAHNPFLYIQTRELITKQWHFSS